MIGVYINGNALNMLMRMNTHHVPAPILLKLKWVINLFTKRQLRLRKMKLLLLVHDMLIKKS